MALTTVRRTSGSRETADAAPTDYLARVQEIAPALAAAAEEIDRRRELPQAIVLSTVTPLTPLVDVTHTEDPGGPPAPTKVLSTTDTPLTVLPEAP